MPGVMSNGVAIMHAISQYQCVAVMHSLAPVPPAPLIDPEPSRVMINNIPVLTDGAITVCCGDRVITTAINVKVNGKPVILFKDKTLQGGTFIPSG
ncbi:PAAR domain-containing protein [Halomonas sp. 328]|uniref:hypothetical protein n=1 Tax=Halomonas sp. 328 TaxID=2776704 RepID=UPI0018A6EBED|nr:hypothetical protein [Halomonas sp. 328]MBF8224206.1 hypothetical protein [Halomonas sp. 328]